MIELVYMFLSFIGAILSFIGLWIVLPIIIYIVIRILLLIIRFERWREDRDYAPTRGYKGRW